MIITMASRRCLQVISRQASAVFSTNPIIHSLKLTTSFPSRSFQSRAYVFPYVFNRIDPFLSTHLSHSRYLSSDSRDGDEEEEEEDEDDEEESEEDYDSEDDGVSVSSRSMKKEYSPEEKEAEAAAIGYRVIGPIQLDQPERIFKAYEPVFAVVQIGSHQFKVSNRDSIYTERLKFCEVNDRLILNKVLLLGSSSQTIVGRPTVPDAVVQAVVEEHALDAKVIIFKKKRRKNYRRTKGHRQELTKLRIISIQGINQPENTVEKPSKAANKKQEKVAVTA